MVSLESSGITTTVILPPINQHECSRYERYALRVPFGPPFSLRITSCEHIDVSIRLLCKQDRCYILNSRKIGEDRVIDEGFTTEVKDPIKLLWLCKADVWLGHGRD